MLKRRHIEIITQQSNPKFTHPLAPSAREGESLLSLRKNERKRIFVAIHTKNRLLRLAIAMTCNDEFSKIHANTRKRQTHL